MAVRVALTHRTTYEYERPAQMGPQIVRLRPAPHNRTPVHSYSLRLEPAEHFLNWQQDPHGNFLARVVVPEKTSRFQVLVDMVVDLESYNPFDFFLEPDAEEFPFTYSTEQRKELLPFLEAEPLGTELSAFLERVDRTKRRTVDFLVDLNNLVTQAVDYVIRMEPGVQTPAETLNLGSGSCRDSAWLLVQAARHLGLAARFVSGYLIQLKPDQKPLEGPPGPETDFTDLHAWTEIYVPGAGWIGLDPTSGLFAAEGHIPLACAPAPVSAAAVEGGVEKVETKFEFDMHVRRIIDVPRVTKPYTDEQWADILTLGDRVDGVLEANDLRLTMGGEPTFVGTRNPDAPEWNTDALGIEKAGIADRLARRLRELWSPGGLFHHGQGKWYPGEQLPRWALSVVSRVDGQPIWSQPELFALTDQPPGNDEHDAERFIRTLVEVLGIDDEGLMPSYEDAWYYMWRERRLPTNVDPLKSKLSDKVERDRLARIFRQGLNKTVGWVLPLGHDGFEFVTGKWFLREEHCFLIPGDSPMGFRLPLDSVPWVSNVDYDGGVDLDPTAPRGTLPDFDLLRGRRQGGGGGATIRYQTPSRDGVTPSRDLPPGRTAAGPGRVPPTHFPKRGERMAPVFGSSALGIVRTALCVEPRDGILRVFLPPMFTAEAFVELA
ncbi:MAG TPA: transglutaminase family protein, partial [Polyangiaceae bacterium]|nr:transglutaminase family protein [Polyangiaceae bacterium]